MTTPPTAAQAVALTQCYMDHETRETMWLMQNIKLQMGGTHAVSSLDGNKDNIDNSSKVYDFSGSNDYYRCDPVNESVMHNTGKNCAYIRSAKVGGECWMVHDKSFHCEMLFLAGPEGRANNYPGQPGPTT